MPNGKKLRNQTQVTNPVAHRQRKSPRSNKDKKRSNSRPALIGGSPAEGAESSRHARLDQLVAGGSVIQDIDVHITSWNVGNKQPPENLEGLVPHLGGGYGLIGIGLQEATYTVKEKRNIPKNALFADGNKHELFEFFGCVQKWLGSKYQPVSYKKLLEMKLMVFCHKAVAPHISQVACMDEATGLLHVVGNKGGLVVRMRVGQTTLAFVSCHLAAHEGDDYLDRRNSDCAEILEGIRLPESVGCQPDLSLVAQTDHVFWFGDLNYRLNLVQEGCTIVDPVCESMKGGKKMDKKTLATAQFGVVKRLVDEQEWKQLWSADQLSHSIKSDRVLRGFIEGTYDFAPTFKVQFEKPGMHYNPERTPSYCDRILWRSDPSLQGNVSQLSLGSSPQVSTSDHKPVWSTFHIKTHHFDPEEIYADRAECPDIVLTGVSGQDLRSCDVTGTSDPYMRYFIGGDNDCIMDTKKSGTIKDSLSPEWQDAMIPLIRCKIASKEVLATKSLIIGLFDYDIESKDDEMGFIQIPLREAIMESPGAIKFSEPVTLNGVAKGTLSGSIKIVWPDKGGKRFHREHQSNESCCKCVTM